MTLLDEDLQHASVVLYEARVDPLMDQLVGVPMTTELLDHVAAEIQYAIAGLVQAGVFTPAGTDIVLYSRRGEDVIQLGLAPFVLRMTDARIWRRFPIPKGPTE
jgi:hypothetical protein